MFIMFHIEYYETNTKSYVLLCALRDYKFYLYYFVSLTEVRQQKLDKNVHTKPQEYYNNNNQCRV